VALPLVGAPAVSAEDQAKPNIWIQVSPVANQLKLSPGDEYDGKLKVTNIGVEAFDFKVYASEYYATDMEYEPIFGQESARSQIARWVSFGQTEYPELQPDISVDVPYHVSVPADAPGGGQYAVLFAETISRDDTGATPGASSIKTVSRVGSLLYAKISGETRETGELVSLRQDNLFLSPPIGSELVVKNTGNVDFSVHYSVKVKSILGSKEIYSSSVDKLVLPNTSRRMELKWEESPWIGLFWVDNEATFLNKTEATDHKLVLIAPIWALIVITVILLLILIVVVAIIVRGVRNRRRKAKKPKVKTVRE
jgi:hypothetical protein